MLASSVGFIGAGQMARALAKGWTGAKLVAANKIFVHDPQLKALEEFASLIAGVEVCADNASVVRNANIVLLAVKPNYVSEALRPLAKELAAHGKGIGPGSASSAAPLFVSIVAGWTLAKLQAELPGSRWIRVMPNTPCLVGESASGFAAGEGVTAADVETVKQLLSGVGRAYQLPEKLLDAVTGLSGSGPAFAFLMIEALSDGGVKMGLPRDVALALAAQTLRGAATMILETGEHPGVLKDRVASPGGTTIAGLNELEAHGVRGALMAAVSAATKRAQELAGG